MALSLVTPVALAGFAYLQRDDPDRFRLTPGLVEALRTKVPARDVVFSDLETSYRIEAYAPVYVSAAPPAHVADTKDNYPRKRREAVIQLPEQRQPRNPAPLSMRSWIVVANRRFDLSSTCRRPTRTRGSPLPARA